NQCRRTGSCGTRWIRLLIKWPGFSRMERILRSSLPAVPSRLRLMRIYGLDEHRTGALYGIPIGPNPGQQDYRRGPGLVPGQWNTYEIEVRGNTYVVRLNGQQTTTFTNTDLFKGKSKTTDSDSGYIGIQSHTGRLKFRNVQVMELQPALVVGPGEIAAAKKVAPVEIPVEEREPEPALVEARKKKSA